MPAAESADRRTPVNVLTGFLGSGKTTLLRHILCEPSFAGTAVLINEFGAVGLDHLLVGAIEGEPVLLASGCICCTIRGDLAAAIRDLHARRQSGRVPSFDRLVVETTGLADPTPILATIASDLVIRHHFRPGPVIATIDALHAEAGLDRHPELAKQIAVADRLVITKVDLAPRAEIDRLRARLGALNPPATLVEAVHGAVDVDALLLPEIGNASYRLAEARAWLEPSSSPTPPHTARITSFYLRHDTPIDWSAFGIWFSLLVHRHGAQLLRVKGILDVRGSDTPVAVHAVQHVIHPPEHLPAWPDAARGSRIVFITDGLPEVRIQPSFAAFMRLSR